MYRHFSVCIEFLTALMNCGVANVCV